MENKVTDYKILYTIIDGVSVYLDEQSEKPMCRIRIYWSGDKGFGQIDIIHDLMSGEYIIDSELMSRDFVKAVLCKLVDDAKIIGGRIE